MQSTGQTSTHERSLVLMHGSAIMYVIQHLHCQWTNSSYEWGPPVVNRSRTNVIAALASLAPRGDHVRTGQDKSPARVRCRRWYTVRGGFRHGSARGDAAGSRSTICTRPV